MSMKKLLLLFLSALFFNSSALRAQTPPSIQWSKCYGGSKNDFPGGILLTSDGGYIMTGSIVSADGDVIGNHGSYDAWIVKLRADGSIQWQKTYGGARDDFAGAICERFEGGHSITGSTISTHGDVKGV